MGNSNFRWQTANNYQVVAGNQPGNIHNYSVEWYGVFIPDSTGNWTFSTDSDDASYIWIGPTADTGYNNTNATVNNRNPHPMIGINQNIKSAQNYVKGQQYSIRMQFGEAGGQYNFILEIKSSIKIDVLSVGR